MNRPGISENLQRPMVIGLLLSTASFIVYLATMSPTVGFIDSGELAAVATLLGIAHPTGYPLFTLLGRLFVMLPIPGEEIFRLNLMAALFCAAGVFVFFHLAFTVLGAVSRQAPAHPSLRRAAAAGAAIMLAFSETWWAQAVAVEVYALHILLAGLTLLMVVRAVEEENDALWRAGAFLLGLSFTNHMTTVLMVPGIAYLYFSRYGIGRTSRTRLLQLFLLFLVGLSLYCYLPLRASAPPSLNWGDPSTLERFIWHLRGKQYSVWIFSSAEVTVRQLKYFVTALPGEFATIGIVAAAVGVVGLWRSARRIAIASLLFFVVCVLYAVNYDIKDIDSYFLLAYIMVALWAGCGLLVAGQWLVRAWGVHRGWVAAALVVTGMVPLVYHYRSIDQSGNRMVEEYTRNMLASLRPDALVFSFQWDYWVSASEYYQLVKGVRPDVAVVDKELLRRSWYLRELEGRMPWLINASRKEVDAFRLELDKFERGVPYNPVIIQARFEEMILSFVARSRKVRPVYVTGEIEAEFTAGFQRVPEGLGFRLEADSLFHEPVMPDLVVRSVSRRGKLEDVIRRMYSEAFLMRGEYFLRAGRLEDAKKAYRSAVSFDPEFSSPRARLAMLGG